jgi:hypothetical protein
MHMHTCKSLALQCVLVNDKGQCTGYACQMCRETHLGRLAYHGACQALHQSLTSRQLQQFSVGGLAAAVCMLQLCKKK